MKSNLTELAEIEFCFPEEEGIRNKMELVDSITSLLKEAGEIDNSGYKNTGLLKQGLFDHIGNGEISKYKKITQAERQTIKNIISKTLEKCHKELTIPVKNFIFIHPFLSTEKDEIFEGVMAVAVYSCVFHLFINLAEYTEKSLENTVTHELNHTIYYFHHFDDFGKYTLLDEILLEGLAENFREQFFDPKITDWAGALTREEAKQIFKNLDDEILTTKEQTLIKEFLFGGKNYKKWTGYSVGYWLVKEFREENREMSWENLMMLEIKNFKM